MSRYFRKQIGTRRKITEILERKDGSISNSGLVQSLYRDNSLPPVAPDQPDDVQDVGKVIDPVRYNVIKDLPYSFVVRNDNVIPGTPDIGSGGSSLDIDLNLLKSLYSKALAGETHASILYDRVFQRRDVTIEDGWVPTLGRRVFYRGHGTTGNHSWQYNNNFSYNDQFQKHIITSAHFNFQFNNYYAIDPAIDYCSFVIENPTQMRIPDERDFTVFKTNFKAEPSFSDEERLTIADFHEKNPSLTAMTFKAVLKLSDKLYCGINLNTFTFFDPSIYDDHTDAPSDSGHFKKYDHNYDFDLLDGPNEATILSRVNTGDITNPGLFDSYYQQVSNPNTDNANIIPLNCQPWWVRPIAWDTDGEATDWNRVYVPVMTPMFFKVKEHVSGFKAADTTRKGTNWWEVVFGFVTKNGLNNDQMADKLAASIQKAETDKVLVLGRNP